MTTAPDSCGTCFFWRGQTLRHNGRRYRKCMGTFPQVFEGSGRVEGVPQADHGHISEDRWCGGFKLDDGTASGANEAEHVVLGEMKPEKKP